MGGPARRRAGAHAREVVARYAAQSPRDTTDIQWYGVLACFKLGIILKGTNARAYAGKAPREIGDMLHVAAVGLFERAALLIEDGVR